MVKSYKNIEHFFFVNNGPTNFIEAIAIQKKDILLKIIYLLDYE